MSRETSQSEGEEAGTKEAIETGTKMLEQLGINPNNYRKYFEVMRRNDVPLTNDLPQFNYVRDMASLERVQTTWLRLKQRYDQIELEGQDENTGRSIIEATKELCARFDTLFSIYVADAKANFVAGKGVLPIPNDLQVLRNEILAMGDRYTKEVPAYVAYRFVGRFELDPEGRREFQVE